MHPGSSHDDKLVHPHFAPVLPSSRWPARAPLLNLPAHDHCISRCLNDLHGESGETPDRPCWREGFCVHSDNIVGRYSTNLKTQIPPTCSHRRAQFAITGWNRGGADTESFSASLWLRIRLRRHSPEIKVDSATLGSRRYWLGSLNPYR